MRLKRPDFTNLEAEIKITNNTGLTINFYNAIYNIAIEQNYIKILFKTYTIIIYTRQVLNNTNKYNYN